MKREVVIDAVTKNFVVRIIRGESEAGQLLITGSVSAPRFSSKLVLKTFAAIRIATF